MAGKGNIRKEAAGGDTGVLKSLRAVQYHIGVAR
jgi:hypothetical protein